MPGEVNHTSGEDPRRLEAQEIVSAGLLLEEKGDLPGAARRFADAAALDPHWWEPWFNLGAVMYQTGDIEGAEGCFHRAATENPEAARPQLALGIILQQRHQQEQAIRHYTRAVRLAPDLTQAHYNLGTVLKEQGRLEEALESFRTAATPQPDHADAHWDLALLHLAFGQFKEGWAEFRWRHLKSGMRSGRSYPQPAWDGSPLGGRTILLHSEQGCGDTIQFARYAPLVEVRGGRVVLECQSKGLKRLLDSLNGNPLVVERGEPLPKCDCQCSLLDLPLLFGTDSESIPSTVPYLHAEPELREAWKNRFSHREGLKVGLVWAGNPRHENDRNRSIPFPLLHALFDVPDVNFISLQVGEAALQQEGEDRVDDVSSYIGDFADTAACLVNLDLVVAVDTAVAHLAGALGVRAWVLLPFVPDWRWFMDREDTPWYPTMRLFRQERIGEWEPVVERVREGLLGELLAAALEAYRAGRTEEAGGRFCRLTAAFPGSAEAAAKGGYVLQDLGRLGEAAELYLRALQLQPGHPEICNAFGTLLQQQGKYRESTDLFSAALEADPAHEAAAVNLGASLRAEGENEKAIAVYRRAIRISPGSPQLRINLGIALQDERRVDEASAVYEDILREFPDHPEARWNRALLLLAIGDFTRGWQEYEWRWRKRIDPTPLPVYPVPCWDGCDPAGKRILIHCEQGAGDCIQFIRYASVLAERGAKVFVHCEHSSLLRLLQSVPGVTGVVAKEGMLPETDFHVPLLSLPRLLHTTLDTIPQNSPYLFPDSVLVAEWRRRVAGEGQLRVGIVWGGNRFAPAYARRTCPPECLAPLSTIGGIRWYSVQVGAPAEEVKSVKRLLDVNDLTSQLNDFADTAAFIANLDLVISVDTSVAHLAGGMGVPVWTLLTYSADWRWLIDRDDSPWYLSMRLFRQHRGEGWTEVVERVRTALQGVIQRRERILVKNNAKNF